jgi:hypothetical protein
MPQIQATFTNDTDASHLWLIVDVGIDPNAPKQLFNDYLDAGASTAPLPLNSEDGIYGHAAYTSAGGQILDCPDLTDGTNVQMK